MGVLTIKECITNLKYFEQKLMTVTTGANIHDISNILFTIGFLLNFPVDLKEKAILSVYDNVVIILMDNYLNENEYKDWISEKEVKTFSQTIKCPQCGEDLKWSGMELTSNPPWYPHSCPQCNYCVNLRSTFPRQVYRYIKNES